MIFDESGSLIREKERPPGDWWSNLGESCSETSRLVILDPSDVRPALTTFKILGDDGMPIAFLRHFMLVRKDGWDAKDFSGDAFFSLWMAWELKHNVALTSDDIWKIPGTDKWLTPAAWALVRGHYRLLNVLNIAQGWLFRLSYRWSDDTHWFERSEGKVQDYLNAICCYLFLKKMGKWATLPRPADECMRAIRKYYLEGPDAEPNSQWIVDLYQKNLMP